MQENESNRFCIGQTLWPVTKVKVAESGIKRLESMVPMSIAGMKILVEKFARKIQH